MYASSSFEASSFELASLAIYASTEAVGADLVVMMISSICVRELGAQQPANRAAGHRLTSCRTRLTSSSWARCSSPCFVSFSAVICSVSHRNNQRCAVSLA